MMDVVDKMDVDPQRIIISLVTPTGEIQAIEVSITLTVGDLKRFINENVLACPPQQQKLIFSTEELVDSFTLSDYFIDNGYVITLHLRSPKWIKIFVEVSEKTMLLEVKTSFNVRSIKQLVALEEQIPVGCQSIYYRGKELCDQSTLADHRITNGSILDVLLKRRGGLMELIVSTSNGNSTSVHVRDTDTVGDLKVKIGADLNFLPGIRPYSMILFYKGKRLRNCQTLADCCVFSHSMLDIVVIKRGYIEVVVKAAFTGRIIRILTLQSSQKISCLKALIHMFEGIPP